MDRTVTEDGLEIFEEVIKDKLNKRFKSILI